MKKTYRFDVITVIPEALQSYTDASILGRAQKGKHIEIRALNPRDKATDKHKMVDDTPYGGGPGMVMLAEPLEQAYEAIAALVKDMPDTLMMVDAITALGVWDISPERDHLDVLVTGSQKALMLPPGLAFVTMSEKAWKRAATSTTPKYYFDLKRELKNQLTNQTAFTPAVSLMEGLKESLKLMQEEGLVEMFARHKRLAAAAGFGIAYVADE